MLGTEGHIPLCAPLTKTNEHKAWNRDESQKLFYCRRNEGKKERRGGDKKRSVHILGCIQRPSTQLPACVPAHERSAYSQTCVSNER